MWRIYVTRVHFRYDDDDDDEKNREKNGRKKFLSLEIVNFTLHIKNDAVSITNVFIANPLTSTFSTSVQEHVTQTKYHECQSETQFQIKRLKQREKLQAV